MPAAEELARHLDDEEWTTLAIELDDLDFTVGLLTAVATAPTRIPPSTWLPIALGDGDLEGPDDPLLGLVVRLHNTIVSSLADDGVRCPAPDQPEAIERFCLGYMMGVGLDEEWHGNFDAMESVVPIAVLSGTHPLNDPEDDEPIEDEDAWVARAREHLPLLIGQAYDRLQDARRKDAHGGGGFRVGTKVGRNDPCSCGSGKKYKKCCGR